MNVTDQNGQPVAGATVTFAVSGGRRQRARARRPERRLLHLEHEGQPVESKKSVTYTTTNVAKAGATWDGERWAVTLRLR